MGKPKDHTTVRNRHYFHKGEVPSDKDVRALGLLVRDEWRRQNKTSPVKYWIPESYTDKDGLLKWSMVNVNCYPREFTDTICKVIDDYYTEKNKPKPEPRAKRPRITKTSS